MIFANKISANEILAHELDIGYNSNGGYFYRVNCFLKSGKRGLAIRKITNRAIDLEDIMTESLAQTIKSKILHQKSGLFLVTGTA
jgi:Tfp pilus assembly pilus retraction ATPase PilT